MVNGSFESGPAGEDIFTSWDGNGPADNNSNYGVAHSSVSPDVAESGNFYAYFHGHPTDSSQDCLGQTLQLVVGAQYNVTFYLGTDGPTTNSGAAMWAVIGPSFGIDYSSDLSLAAYYPNSASALPYQKFSTNFTATSISPILSFHGIDFASSILLDNVSVTRILPQLNVQLSPAKNLVFTWTNPAPAYVLQTNASLHTTNWGTLPNTPVTIGSTNQITLPMPTGSLFYRLTGP